MDTKLVKGKSASKKTIEKFKKTIQPINKEGIMKLLNELMGNVINHYNDNNNVLKEFIKSSLGDKQFNSKKGSKWMSEQDNFSKFILNLFPHSISKYSLITFIGLYPKPLTDKTYRLFRNFSGIKQAEIMSFFIATKDNENTQTLPDIIKYYSIIQELDSDNIFGSVKEFITQKSINFDIYDYPSKITIDVTPEVKISIFEFLQDLADFLYLNHKLNIIFIDRSNIKNAEYIYASELYNESMPDHIFLVDVTINLRKANILFDSVMTIDINNVENSNYVIKDQKLEYFLKRILNFKTILKENTPAKPDTSDIIIEYNPYDIDELLNVIEVQITPTEKRQYLIGKAIHNSEKDEYNLYEDNSISNNLVGKLSFIDGSKTDVNISWCDNYSI